MEVGVEHCDYIEVTSTYSCGLMEEYYSYSKFEHCRLRKFHVLIE